jgi:hypothetical protein
MIQLNYRDKIVRFMDMDIVMDVDILFFENLILIK